MTSTVTASLEEEVILPSMLAVSTEKSATAVGAEMLVVEELPPPEVTSNIRHGSPTPEAPSFNEMNISYRPRTQSTMGIDPMFALPPPDIAPRFVFNSDTSYIDEPTATTMLDDASDTAPLIQTPASTPPYPPPRIYFAPSAISFIPSLSYDLLARDPSVKSVPRNYRAWARTGRPKMDLDGAERIEAKRDFVAMGRTWPNDGESDDDGDEGDGDKKRKRKKKKSTKALMVPIERPRRTIRKVVEAEPPVQPPLQRKRVNEVIVKGPENQEQPEVQERRQAKEKTEIQGKVDKREKLKQKEQEEEEPKAAPAIRISPAAKKGETSKSSQSGSSGRRSSSTLLDTDVAEMGKRKRVEYDQVAEVPAAKKQRVSKRLHAKRYGPKDAPLSPAEPEEEELKHSQSPLTALTPSPEPSPPSPPRISPVPSDHRHPSPVPSRPGPSRPVGRPPRSTVATPGPSRAANLPASRPGHRLSRDALPIQPQSVPMRTFPTSLPIIPGYSAFYRRYPLITQFDRDDAAGKYVNVDEDDSQPKRALGNWNPPRDYRDLYTPRYTKGSGNKKIALCPLCYEDPARGGEGKQEWNHTKTSQHNYHMQYYHGISATTCAPFAPPISQRTVAIPRPQTNEKSEILQGKCHVCKQWIALEGCKLGELKVKELLWWKHAAGCHKESKLPGEADAFLEDDAYRRLIEYEISSFVNIFQHRRVEEEGSA